MALKSKVTKEDLERYLDDGLTMTEIGSIYGCDRKNITHYMKKFGIPPRDMSAYMKSRNTEKRGHDVTIEEVVGMVNDGMFLTDIAKTLGVSRSFISSLCKENNLNFKNHETQRKMQSEFMKTNNPIKKGEKREKRIGEITTKARIAKFHDKLCKLHGKMTMKEYSKYARHIAYSYYKMNGLYEDGKVIDHIYSIKDGYDNNIHPLIISHPGNLRLITVEENMEKGSKSLITLEELYESVGVQRLSITE